MVKNRYFSNTMGNFSELAIVTQVDASDGTAANAQPSVVSQSITVAGSPTATDTITFTFTSQPSGQPVISPATYTVPASGTTAQANAGIKAALEAALAGIPGASVNFTGTTTQVVTIGLPGATYNGMIITTTETGTTFDSAPAAGTFAGGVNADATAADNIKDFVDNALAGSIWAFWDDTNLALKAGDTTDPANVGRKFYYAWKQGVVTEYNKSTAIPVKDLEKDTAAYNAGTAQVMTLTGTGTVSAGQILHVKIIDTTGTQLPYPHFSYSTPIVSTVDAAYTALAVLINAEALSNTPIVTASATTNVLTITAKTKLVTFDIASFIEVTTAYPTDAYIGTKAITAKAKAPIGDIASVTELQKYYIMNNGGVQYSDYSIQAYEFGAPTTNVGTNSVTQFGFLLLRQARAESGVTRNYNQKAYMLIAIKNTDLTTLAAL